MPETGLVIDLPDTSWLPLEYAEASQENQPSASKPVPVFSEPVRKFRTDE